MTTGAQSETEATMIDLIRPQYVNKLRAAQQHLAHVQQLGPLEPREFLRDAEREVAIAQKKTRRL